MPNLSLPRPVYKALDRLKQGGQEGYVVGGSVRDSLLCRPVHDWDIATSANIAEMTTLFTGYPIIATGEKHGALTVLIDGMPLEITTYRVDGAYADHRHPDKVRFTRSLSDDLYRRDFTINALAYHPDSGVVDLVGGLADLRAGVLRAVGNPQTRFQEDGLRLLRAVRFSAVLGFPLEARTAQAVHECAPLLSYLSSERIQAEFSQLLLAPVPALLPILTAYADLFFVFLPELRPLAGFEQRNRHHCYDVWTHTLHAVAATPDNLTLRLAALFHDSGKPAVFSIDARGEGHFYHHAEKSAAITGQVLTRLRYDRRTIRQCVQLVRHHRLPLTVDKFRLRCLCYQLGLPLVQMLLQLVYADYAAKSSAARQALPLIRQMQQTVADIQRREECVSLAALAVNGRDLAALGLSGPQIGAALERLLYAVMSERCPNQRQALLAYTVRRRDKHE